MLHYQLIAILNNSKQELDDRSRLQSAIDASKKDRIRRQNMEKLEEIVKEANRGLGLFEDIKDMNFFFIYGCRPSTGVKANTTMVKDILHSFIETADRINYMVLLPQAFGFLAGNDVTFETA